MPQKRERHYERQKSQSYAYFRVRALPEERAAMGSAQFTIYDFVSNAFSFSTPKKELAISVFEELAKGQKPFKELLEATGAGKSSLYLVLVALERSGLVERAGEGKGASYRLSGRFSDSLREYAGWWERWVARSQQI